MATQDTADKVLELEYTNSRPHTAFMTGQINCDDGGAGELVVELFDVGGGRDVGELVLGQLRERHRRPDDDRQQEDHRAGLLKEDPSAVPDGQERNAQGRPAVGRQFEDELLRFAFEYGLAEHKRRAHGREDAEHVGTEEQHSY